MKLAQLAKRTVDLLDSIEHAAYDSYGGIYYCPCCCNDNGHNEDCKLKILRDETQCLLNTLPSTKE